MEALRDDPCVIVATECADRPPFKHPLRSLLWLSLGLLSHAPAYAAELRGQLDLGYVATDTNTSWVNSGLGKSRYDSSMPTGRLVLRGDTDLFSDLVGRIVVDGDSARAPVVGLQEAWISWNPVPTSPWRTRIKAGAFFPVSSLEVDYDSVGWTPIRTISNSAINSWISEEIRIKGVELALLRRGLLAGSPHTFGATAGAFMGNDPAGTLLAWRGWDLGNRITGLGQGIVLPDLPIYRPAGGIPIQTRDIHPFREVDDRAGYYGSLNYGYLDVVEVAAMHYDNRGDPLRIKQRQYSWHTRFDHVSLRFRREKWELLAQAMRGDTLMGANAVSIDFSSWYLLASHPLGVGLITLRHDRFRTVDKDIFPTDPNSERGHAWTLAYRYPLTKSLQLITEALVIDSNRAARVLIDEPNRQIERSLNVELRWAFDR